MQVSSGQLRLRLHFMASKTSPAEAQKTVIRMGEFGRRIAARKAELGLPDDSAHPELCRRARNAGQNRAPSKRALLTAIEDAGGEW